MTSWLIVLATALVAAVPVSLAYFGHRRWKGLTPSEQAAEQEEFEVHRKPW